MKNKKKGRNKFRAGTVKKAEDTSEVQKMPVPVEIEQVEETPIENIKTQVQDEPNNNELTSVPEETNVSVEVVENNVKIVEETKTDAIAQDSKTELLVLEADEVIKHPLEHTWGLWLYTNEKKNWADNLKQLTLFDTVEDYWCLYHHTKLPSELESGQDYSVFKSGISPMWEHPANRPGGRWFINLEQRFKLMDRVWLDLVLLMIGENFVNTDLICGAVVNVRTKKPNKITIWTRSKNEIDVIPIGRQLKQMLQIHSKLQFLDHKNNCLFFI